MFILVAVHVVLFLLQLSVCTMTVHVELVILHANNFVCSVVVLVMGSACLLVIRLIVCTNKFLRVLHHFHWFIDEQ